MEKETFDFKVVFETFKTFKRHYKPYWKLLVLAFFCLLATIVVSMLIPWPLKLILDQVILEEPLMEEFSFLNGILQYDRYVLLAWFSAAIVILAILNSVFSFFNKYISGAVGAYMQAAIRERIFAHLQKLSLAFHSSTRSGNMIYLITNDVFTMKSMLVQLPEQFTRQTLIVISYISLMLVLDWRLCLMGIGTVPFIAFVIRYFAPKMQTAMLARREKESEIAAVVSENLNMMTLVQAYARQESMNDKFRVHSKESLDSQVKFLKLTRTFSRSTEFFTVASMTAVLYFGAQYTLARDITPGILVLFMAYIAEIHGSIEKFNRLYEKFVPARAAARRLLKIVSNESVIEDSEDAPEAPALSGRIEFSNISFSYQNSEETTLKDISFQANPGETIALVGPSGAGKSTLISLLLRFYDPLSGKILMDGIDIKKYRVKSIRNQITVVMQDAKLFQQSVYENIAFGKINASSDEVVLAAQRAEAHEFITRMPKGYQTRMEEGGDNLSGGQKQRINIARAIIRNTPIIILDEPAAGVDWSTENKINEAINHLKKDKTTFIIAHKLYTVMHADKILLLNNGRIEAAGTHPELLQSSSTYQDLYEAQFGWQKEYAANGNGTTQKESIRLT